MPQIVSNLQGIYRLCKVVCFRTYKYPLTLQAHVRASVEIKSPDGSGLFLWALPTGCFAKGLASDPAGNPVLATSSTSSRWRLRLKVVIYCRCAIVPSFGKLVSTSSSFSYHVTIETNNITFPYFRFYRFYRPTPTDHFRNTKFLIPSHMVKGEY